MRRVLAADIEMITGGERALTVGEAMMLADKYGFDAKHLFSEQTQAQAQVFATTNYSGEYQALVASERAASGNGPQWQLGYIPGTTVSMLGLGLPGVTPSFSSAPDWRTAARISPSHPGGYCDAEGSHFPMTPAERAQIRSDLMWDAGWRTAAGYGMLLTGMGEVVGGGAATVEVFGLGIPVAVAGYGLMGLGMTQMSLSIPTIGMAQSQFIDAYNGNLKYTPNPVKYVATELGGPQVGEYAGYGESGLQMLGLSGGASTLIRGTATGMTGMLGLYYQIPSKTSLFIGAGITSGVSAGIESMQPNATPESIALAGAIAGGSYLGLGFVGASRPLARYEAPIAGGTAIVADAGFDYYKGGWDNVNWAKSFTKGGLAVAGTHLGGYITDYAMKQPYTTPDHAAMLGRMTTMGALDLPAGIIIDLSTWKRFSPFTSRSFLSGY